jgi:hypothetical protein
MENQDRKSAKENNALLVFFMGLIGGIITIVVGIIVNEPMAILAGCIGIILGIVFGILPYIRSTRFKETPGLKKTLTACVLIGIMLGFPTTRTVKTTNTEEVPAFNTTNVFNSTLQIGTQFSGFGEYSIESMTEIQIGETVGIVVQVNGAQDMYCWSFSITWDDSILILLSLTEGSFLQAGYQTIFTYAEPKSGPIYDHIGSLTECRKGDVPGASGYGVIAWFTFKADAPGTTNITISDAKWVDGNLIRHNFPAIDPMVIVVADPPPSTNGGSGGSRMPCIQ